MSKQLILPLAIGVVLLAVGTLMQGKYAERWGRMTSAELDQFTACIDRVPRVIGNWKGKDDPPISDEVWQQTNCTNYVSRVYENSTTGQAVSMYLVSGTAKHITIHSPDWCYVGAGFNMDGRIENHTVKMPAGTGMTDPEFATAIFRKTSGGTESGLRIFWTYSDDGNWEGPANANVAKATYGGKPAMYKIYLVAEPVPANESPGNDFVRDAFPTLNTVLFGSSKSAGEKPVEPSSSDLDL